MELARGTFKAMVATASPSDLRRTTIGTRWTNQQLLFHMLLGYMVVLRLLRLDSGSSDGSRTSTA